MSKPLKLKACDRCAAIKQVCDRRGDAACARCSRLELPCAITRVHKPMGRPKKQKAPPPYADLPPTPPPDNIDPELLDSPVLKVATPPSPTGSCSPPSSTASTKPKRVQRTRSGCVTCKQRRKKCDEARPSCGDCRRLGLECIRAPVSPRASISRPSTCTALSEAPRPPVADPLSTLSINIPMTSFGPAMNAGELWLLQHYQEQVARSLSVVPDEINSFIKLFIPMAMLQPAMRNALMGLSATHLKRKHPEWGVSAVEYQNKAVKLANALLIKGGEENMMEGLATVLFLCLQEICEGQSRQWPMHLEAAVTLINNKGGPASYPPSVRFLIESVAYLDSVATLSLTKSAFLDQQFYLPPSPSTPLDAHALFGTSHALFAIIADISQLSQISSIRYSSPTSENSFRQMASELELQLQTWAPVVCTSYTSDPDLNYKVTAAGLMLQWAALMRLHLIVEAEDPRGIMHPKVRTAVRNILAALEAIPKGDLVESMLVFPMFAAGFGAVTREERETVRERFKVMEKSIGFGNVFDAHELVEMKWREEEDQEEEGECEGIINTVTGRRGMGMGMTWECLVKAGEQTLLMG